MKKRIALVLIFLFLLFSKNVLASEAENILTSKTENKKFNIILDKETILKGYTVSAFSDKLKLSLVPGILSEDTEVAIEEINPSEVISPWNLDLESSILQFEFKNKSAYDNHKPFYIQFSYDEKDSNYKQVFFYDKNYATWRPLPTWDFPEEKFVRSLIHLPYARIAVFSYPEILSVGQASWYKYKGGDFTASPDFPKGSVLRVKNLANGKYVDVTVNDFGPDRSIFPDRILDLDYEAFKKIANKGEGLINISVEPLSIAKASFDKKLLVELGSGEVPEINSVGAILIKESDNSILYEKNSEQALPIASLTKILSVYTFLQEGNNSNRLEEIIKYDVKDEEYNFKYFPKWEVALVNLKSGDLLSVKDLVYSALVRSANNVVETLARVSGLSRDDFIKKINSWAQENGATTVKINEPTGLDKNNVSSAKDLAMLASIIFENKLMSQASVTPSYRFSTRNDNSLKLRYNSSDLVLNNNFKNFKIIGSKTGYLDEAGYCLITRAEINGEKYIAVILNASSRVQSFSETIDLFNFASYKISK
ncbi:MAG TPA: RlpA-like double-psi beta-barrel domain-containing protein [bacterium]|nr:RlpA-like double-psi beta-barrel domain-containing protein [bacterium]